MMPIPLYTALLGVFAATVMSAQAVPTIEVSPQTVDLGLASSRKAAGFSVRLVNKGAKGLFVSEIKADAGCEPKRNEPMLILPGQSRDVAFTCTPDVPFGVYTKTIRFVTNDPACKVHIASVRGEVAPPVRISHPRVKLAPEPHSGLVTGAVDVHYTDPELVPLETGFESDCPWITAHWESIDAKAGKGRFQIVANPRDFPAGSKEVRARIEFITGERRLPVLPIQVIWKAQTEGGREACTAPMSLTVLVASGVNQ